jgi:alpha-L-fucosidase
VTWWSKADGEDLYNYVKELNPDILINERVCRGFGLGDYECPEQKVPSAPLSRSWETCETMNGAWGYKASRENSYKTVEAMIQEMVTVTSRGGNFLLNIGPTGDGTLTSGAINILSGFGTWMDTYSSSIYGTSGNPFGKDPGWGAYTQKGKKLYAHVYKWPGNGKLQVTALKGKIKKIYLLNDTKTSLKYSVKNGIITISVPKTAPNVNDSVVVIQYSTLTQQGTGESK